MPHIPRQFTSQIVLFLLDAVSVGRMGIGTVAIAILLLAVAGNHIMNAFLERRIVRVGTGAASATSAGGLAIRRFCSSASSRVPFLVPADTPDDLDRYRADAFRDTGHGANDGPTEAGDRLTRTREVVPLVVSDQTQVTPRQFALLHQKCSSEGREAQTGLLNLPHRHPVVEDGAPHAVFARQWQIAMEAVDSVLGPVALRDDIVPQLLCIGLHLGREELVDALDELVDREALVGHRLVIARPRLGDHGRPEGLVAEEGNDHGGLAALESDGGRARPAVMDDSAHTRKDPVVWRVVEQVHVVRTITHAQTTPAFAHQRSHAGLDHRLEDDHLARVSYSAS